MKETKCLHFFVKQPKKTVLGVLNAVGEVTTFFLTAGNYLPFSPAQHLRRRESPNIVLLDLLNGLLNLQSRYKHANGNIFMGYTHFLLLVMKHFHSFLIIPPTSTTSYIFKLLSHFKHGKPLYK